MGFFSSLRSMVPVSSRSFHSAHRHFDERMDELYAHVDGLHARVDELHQHLDMLDRGINGNIDFKYECFKNVPGKLDAHAMFSEYMYWELYRREGEPLIEAKRRFFREMPKAEGVNRLIQLCCAQLLREFDALCRQNGISYWLMSGTLLGGVRHGGFIPWDDDIDLGVTRFDLGRLMAVVKEDTRYFVSEAYDPNAKCRQIRFWYSNSKVPCFLDLFVFDCMEGSVEDGKRSRAVVRDKILSATEADFAADYWRDASALGVEDERVSNIVDAFSEADCFFGSSRPDEFGDREAVIFWAVDNLDDDVTGKLCYEMSAVFPLGEMSFEGIVCLAPKNFEKILEDIYGDIYTIPHDVATHYKHVDESKVYDMETALADLYAGVNVL